MASSPPLNTQTSSSRRRASAAITFSLLVFGMGQSFIFTSIPPIGRELGWAESRVGIIMMSGATVLVCFSFLWGRWVNRVGLRRAMQLGMLAYGITTLGLGLLFAFALAGAIDPNTAFILAIALRVVFSATSGGVFPSAQAYFVGASTPETRTSAIATIGIAFSVGMTIGPAVAALASNVSLYAPFYIMATLGLASTVLLQLCVPSQVSAYDSGDSTDDDKQLAPMKWATHPVLPFLFLIMIVSLSMNAIQQIAVFYIQDLLSIGTTEAAQRGGSAMTVMSVVMIVIQIVAAQRLKMQPSHMINLGGIALLTAMLVFVFAPSWLGFLLAMGLTGAGIGFLYPAVIASQTLRAEPSEQARVAGANVSAQGIGLALGPVSSASLYQINTAYPFMLVGSLAVLILIVSNTAKRSHN